MRYRRFGSTDWRVSEVGLGGAWFYGRPEEGLLPDAHGVKMVERALELGVNYFDTAPLYGRGRSEKVFGLALEGVTESHYLATKVGYFPEPFDYTRDAIWRGFDASLQRLRRDRVDLVQVHEAEQAGWDGIFGRERTLETLVEIRSQGLAQHIGLTGSDLTLMSEILKETDEFVSVVTFCKYDLLTQEAREVLVPAAAAENVAVIAASPLHGGLLGSKRDRFVENGRYREMHARLRRVEALFAGGPQDLVNAALRYLLSDPRVTMLLCGASDFDELEMCASVSDGQYLTPDLIRQIEEA